MQSIGQAESVIGYWVVNTCYPSPVTSQGIFPTFAAKVFEKGLRGTWLKV